jgi:glutamate carboxypeptidase
MTTAEFLAGNSHPMTASNPFDTSAILDGIRQWVEIETPTEAPGRSTGWQRSSPTAIAICRRASSASQDRTVAAIWWRGRLGTDAPGILVLRPS